MCQGKIEDNSNSPKTSVDYCEDCEKRSDGLLLVMGMLAGMFVAIFIIRVFAGKGVLSLLIGVCPQLQPVFERLSPYFTAGAMIEVGKAIGLSSALILGVYASLDKMESGFYYSELLSFLYPQYDLFALLHLLFVLLGLWQAKVGGRDAALVALLLVFVDCIPQWHSIENLVLHPDKRRELAEHKWNIIVGKFEEKPEVNAKESIYKLADAITLSHDGNYRRLIGCFARAIIAFSGIHTDMRQRLIALTNVWERLLENRSENERYFLTEEVLANVEKQPLKDNEDEEKREETKFSICAALVLYLCTMHARRGTGRTVSDTDYSAILTAVCDDLVTLEQNDELRNNRIECYYLNLNFTMLVWLHMLYGQIKASNICLTSLSPKEADIKTFEEKWVIAAVDAHFLNASDSERERLVKAVLKQISCA